MSYTWHESIRSVIGDESRVIAAFSTWLRLHGWVTELEVGFIDVVASRRNQHLYAEAKGRTVDAGLDVDTLYGQLLRRMPAQADGSATFTVVLRDTAVWAAERVPARNPSSIGH
jgi:hypothetical protein